MTTGIAKSRSVPWPKDYLKHLRTVHFALVTVSVVLILLSSSPSKSTVEIAREQNQQIGEFLHEFQISWLEDYVSEVVARNQKEALPNSTAPNPSFPKVLLDPTDANAIQYSYKNFSIKKDVVLPIEVEAANWILVSSHLTQSHGGKNDYRWQLPTELNVKPKSLRSFRLLWDNLGTSDLHLEIPFSVSTTAWLEIPQGNPVLQSTALKFQKTGDSLGELLSLELLPEEEAKTLEKLGLPQGIRYYYAVDHHLTAVTRAVHELDRDSTDYRLLDSLIIPVTRLDKIPYDGQAAILSHTEPSRHWHHGTFSQVFKELGDITKPYEDLPPETIDDILASEEKRYGESFEALGIKFPAENTTLWGILVILAIQTYLCIQLLEFDLRLHIALADAEVAWIGLYQSVRARIVMFTSVCILPTSAVAFLSIRALHLVDHKFSFRFSLASSALTTFSVGLLIWFRLPRESKTTPSERQAFVEYAD